MQNKLAPQEFEARSKTVALVKSMIVDVEALNSNTRGNPKVNNRLASAAKADIDAQRAKEAELKSTWLMSLAGQRERCISVMDAGVQTAPRVEEVVARMLNLVWARAIFLVVDLILINGSRKCPQAMSR